MVKIEEFAKDFDNLGDQDKNRILLNVPIKPLVNVYAKYCDRVQIIDLFDSWDDLAQNPDKVGGLEPSKVSDIHIKRIKMLIKKLNKRGKSDYIPDWINDIYG